VHPQYLQVPLCISRCIAQKQPWGKTWGVLLHFASTPYIFAHHNQTAQSVPPNGVKAQADSGSSP
jgi:hypothetical protein